MKKKPVFLLLTLMALSVRGDNIYVFFPAIARPQVIQKEIASALPGTDVLVFGRYSDFIAKVETDSPSAVLAIPELVKQFSNYEITLSADNNGRDQEPLVLMSVDGKIPRSKVATLGMVDLLGKKGTEVLIRGLFPGTPRLKRVTKIEDLLPLLSFDMADAVVVTQEQADYLRKTSKLKLATTELPEARLGLVCLAVRAGASAKSSLRHIRSLPVAGVKKWR